MSTIEMLKDAKKMKAALLLMAQERLNAMNARELMLDVEFLEFCGSYGLVREIR